MQLRRFLFLLFTLISLGPPALYAQGKTSIAITSTQCATIDVTSQSSVGIQVTGTWTGTLQPQISIQGQSAQNIQVTPSTSSTTPQSTITANGIYKASVAGGTTFLVCGATVTSGTANVFVNSSTGVSVSAVSAAVTPTALAGVNVITNCGAKGGTTDDTAAINACLAANPGRLILFPKTAANGSACDYTVSGTLTLTGNGQLVKGESYGYFAGTHLCQSVNFNGPTFTLTNTACVHCGVEDIWIDIPASIGFVSSVKNSCIVPAGMSGVGAGPTGTSVQDGILVQANFAHIYRVLITSMGRHGVNFDNSGGTSATFADDADVQDVYTYNVRGHGFYGVGSDFNAGTFWHVKSYFSQFWGIFDNGFLGNKYYGSQMTGNHLDQTSAGGTTAVNLTRAANVGTASNYTAHGLVVGNAFVISGAGDANYNGTWYVASVIDANTVTFALTVGGASTTGNARIATCGEAWTASTLDGGPIKAIGVSQSGLFSGSYSESGQPTSKIQAPNSVFGGNLSSSSGLDFSSASTFEFSNGNLLKGRLWKIWSPTDATGLVVHMASGATGYHGVQIVFSDNLFTAKWAINGSSATIFSLTDSTNSLTFFDYNSGFVDLTPRVAAGGFVRIQAGNIGFTGGKGQHWVNQAAASDSDGTCTAAAATTCVITFTTAYTAAPACVANDNTAVTTVKTSTTTGALTITTTAATSDVFSYHCAGNPN